LPLPPCKACLPAASSGAGCTARPWSLTRGAGGQHVAAKGGVVADDVGLLARKASRAVGARHHTQPGAVVVDLRPWGGSGSWVGTWQLGGSWVQGKGGSGVQQGGPKRRLEQRKRLRERLATRAPRSLRLPLLLLPHRGCPRVRCLWRFPLLAGSVRKALLLNSAAAPSPPYLSPPEASCSYFQQQAVASHTKSEPPARPAPPPPPPRQRGCGAPPAPP
jgi:hypothetical protein